jgi:hypothetical protein
VADEIEQIRRAEERRGRRPIDIETIQERRRLLAAMKDIWNDGTVDDLKAAMRVYGLSEKSPEWSATLRTWNAERGQN